MAKIKKIPVWLLLTFIPYLVAIGMILNFGIFGASFMGTTMYGLKGMSYGLFVVFASMIVIPIIPACLIIQISYLIYRIRKNKNSSSSIKKYVIVTVVVFLVFVAVLLLLMFQNSLRNKFAKQRAELMYMRAEEIVHYEFNQDVYVYGLEKFEHSTMMVDWDRNQIGFVIEDGGGRFYVYDLKPMSDDELSKYEDMYSEIYQESEYVFENGNVMRTYTDEPYDRPYSSETILIVVETPDGERFASETYFGTYLHLSPNCFEE